MKLWQIAGMTALVMIGMRFSGIATGLIGSTLGVKK